jgi:hypothetical protein
MSESFEGNEDDGSVLVLQREENLARIKSSERSTISTTQPVSLWKHRCCPKPIKMEALPLYLCFVALMLTHAGSWSCTYFKGAEITITDGHYGLVREQNPSSQALCM